MPGKGSNRGTRRFDGKVFYLVERELTKTAAKTEARRYRKAGSFARITQEPSTGLKKLGRYAVWARKKS